MTFRFVHTADIHLDSPLQSLSLRDPEIAELIGIAMRQSFSRTVDLCLDERVDALMIAGDLYDRELRSMKSGAFFSQEMRRLDAAGIRVFIIKGNHDAESVVTKRLALPENVHVFTGRAEAVPIEGRDVVVHGVSFAQAHIADSLLPKYKPPLPGNVNIGLLHTSLSGSAAHDVYAPCGLVDLTGHGFDYWALGHIHQRQIHASGPATVVMAGIPQGRHINEGGAKSVSLVEILEDGTIRVHERFTGIAQFERVAVDVAGVEDWSQILRRIETALGEAADAAKAGHLVARLEILGRTPLAMRLRRDLDVLIEEARQSAGARDRIFVEAVDLHTHAPEQARSIDGDDPLTELRLLMGREAGNREVLKDAARLLIEDLQQKLPPELRDRFGDSEARLAELAESFIEEGGETLLARFEADRTGA